MLLEIIRNDITKIKVDAIVGSANESLLGGSADGVIHLDVNYDITITVQTLSGHLLR